MSKGANPPAKLELGQVVYDEGGEELGTIQGFDRGGFFVIETGLEAELEPITTIRDVTGMAYVMWRCADCGEMGQLDGELPEQCPNCDAPREDLYYLPED